jgi:hypothetical protein
MEFGLALAQAAPELLLVDASGGWCPTLARRFNRAPNVSYYHCHILRELPAGPFDNVV